ncbi:MAG: 3-deoxy-D-manno-octulosonic acid transferase, partial [Bacteroidales bacterium]|nr:3-deoxy-D-manno-octulosonic acid transferase [Bacteroidales bacterium]
GIHNTLEAATFGKPICFGKRYNHFQEAVDLVEREAAFAISNSEELSTILNRLCDDDVFYNNAAKASVEYTNEKAGACDRIFNYLHL